MIIRTTKKASTNAKPIRVDLEQSLSYDILAPILVPNTPTMKPPKCPMKSILPSNDVKSSPKMTKNATMHIIWHLKIGLIFPNAVQLIIKYPRQ